MNIPMLWRGTDDIWILSMCREINEQTKKIERNTCVSERKKIGIFHMWMIVSINTLPMFVQLGKHDVTKIP